MTDQKSKSDIYFVEDCLNAITTPILALKTTVRQQLQEFHNTFEDNTHMSIIEEEQSQQESKDINPIDLKYQQLRAQFNSNVRILIKAQKEVVELTSKYKQQLKSMATGFVECQEQIKKLTKENQSLKNEIKSKKAKKQKQIQEQLYVRRPPSPIVQANRSIQKQKVARSQQQRHNWKSLSLKIQQCKKKIAIYEHQIQDKEEEMSKLRALLIQKQKQKNHQKYDQEIKKLKKDNTTLRGQKVLVSSQLTAVKKQLNDAVQVNEVQQSEIKRLRMQIDNLSSSLNWHASNLNQLRNSCKKMTNKQTQINQSMIDSLSRVNAIMASSLAHQQQLLENINQKCKKIQQNWVRQGQKHQKKIVELENILEDKNETIIKLKSSSKGDKNNYYADMVKVLNKKLAEKEDRIRYLQEHRYNNSPRQVEF